MMGASSRVLILLVWLGSGAAGGVLVAQAAPPRAKRWTTWDKIGVAAGGALILIDWSQTLDGNRRFGSYGRDGNPVLGQHPSEGRINAVIGTTFVLYVAGAVILPKEERRGLMGLTIFFELTAVPRNIGVGCRLAWP